VFTNDVGVMCARVDKPRNTSSSRAASGRSTAATLSPRSRAELASAREATRADAQLARGWRRHATRAVSGNGAQSPSSGSVDRLQAADCATCETATGKLDRIVPEIHLDDDLDDDQRARLLDIADRCPARGENPMLATQNGTRKLTATRTHVPDRHRRAARPLWFTADRIVPTTTATGAATRTVRPRTNNASAWEGRDQLDASDCPWSPLIRQEPADPAPDSRPGNRRAQIRLPIGVNDHAATPEPGSRTELATVVHQRTAGGSRYR
jgi:hypothetical protein